jgi:capsular exopolysaccharide synthesis family protein
MDLSNISEELHLKDYLQVIGRRRGNALLFFITVMFFVTIGTILTTPTFQASVKILIDLESPNVLTTSGNVSLQNPDYYAYKEYFQTQKEVLASRTILQRVFDEFAISKTPDYSKESEPLEKFMRTVKVEPVRDTRLVILSVSNKDPGLAAKIANRIAEIYVKQNLYYTTKEELTNLLKNEYLKLEAQLSDNAKIYKEKHPKMIRLRQEMNDMRSKLENLKNSTISYDAETEKLQDKYSHALTGFKANNVRILDPAEAPKKPIKPKKKINFALGFFLGIMGGIALVFFVEYLDDSLQGIIDLKKLVKWPFLGSIPDIKRWGKNNRCIIASEKRTDPVTEAYRSVRSSLVYSTPKDSPLKTFVVTSPGPQEGKTTTLCNLGIVFAQSGKQVLLVDADMRKPRLFKVFDRKLNAGFSNFLTGEKMLDDVIQKTDIANLFLVTSGPVHPDASELLSSEKMKEFLTQAKEKFDYVIFDSPPVPVVTDAIIISNLVEGVAIVVQKGVTSRRTLRQVSQLLSDAKINVLGAILNKSPVSAAYGRYSYYYK